MEYPQVVVLAGGLGTRLRPATGDTLPKSLAPVADRPFLEHLLEELWQAGAREVLLLVGWGAQRLREAMADGSTHSLRIAYSLEPEPLGTGGALLWAQTQGLLADRFLLTNGDTLLEEGYRLIVDAHSRERRRHEAVATLVGVRASDTTGFGALEVEPWSPATHSGRPRLLRLVDIGDQASGEGIVYAGVAVVERLALDPPYASARFSVEPASLSLERDVIRAWLQAGLHVSVHVSASGFVDIGTPDQYARFRASLESAASSATTRPSGPPGKTAR